MSGHSGRGTRTRRDPPNRLPGGVSAERCYCWDIRLPFCHTLADHRLLVVMRPGSTTTTTRKARS